MKVEQTAPEFSPVTIVLETREELSALWDVLHFTGGGGEPLSRAARALAIDLSNTLSSEIHQ